MLQAAYYSDRQLETVDTRWGELERWTLEVCVMRAEGREREAVRVLKEQMPALIREWSAHCGLERAAIQERLRRLFEETQNFVARGLAQRRLITADLLARGDAKPRNHMPSGGAVGLRHRVPVGDVVGMLDGLAEAEREAKREALWPMRSRATGLAACL